MSSETSTYTGFQFEMDGFPALAIINKDLNDREVQSGYPFSVFVEIVPDAYNDMGHPEEAEHDYLVDIEKKDDRLSRETD